MLKVGGRFWILSRSGSKIISHKNYVIERIRQCSPNHYAITSDIKKTSADLMPRAAAVQ